MNIDYIRAVTAAKLLVDGYQVDLRATISGNLDLVPDGKTTGDDDWQARLAAIDPDTQRVVLFAREPDSRFVAKVMADTKKLGLTAVVHSKPADQPLKFGYRSPDQRQRND